jgi:hypothetical protein
LDRLLQQLRSQGQLDKLFAYYQLTPTMPLAEH